MKKDKLDERFDQVVDEKTFLEFVKALQLDRGKCEGKSMDEVGFVEDWANNDIEGFLEASIAWAEDTNFGDHDNPWKKFANFLYAGNFYE